MSHPKEKGIKVNNTELCTKIPSPRTAFFATLRAFLHAQGSGAPSRPRPAARVAGRLWAAAACAGLAFLCAGVAGPSVASAAFTRPFLRQITGTAPGAPFGEFGPLGLAVDAEDDLWVSEDGKQFKPPYPLDEFNSAEHENAFLKTLEVEGLERNNGFTPPASLAINHSTGSFYTTGGTGPTSARFVEVFDSAGVFSFGWGPLPKVPTHVAVDDSSESTAGSVYVSVFEGILKFNAAGKPENFSAAVPYVSGSEITGTPSEPFASAARPEGVAVDSHGDIYTVALGAQRSEREEPAVEEFAPSGKFVQAFTGKETPGLGGSHVQGGFGGVLQRVAVDPLNGHVLVSLLAGQKGHEEGAVDEFDSAGHFLSQIIATAPGSHLREPREMATDSKGDLYVIDSATHTIVVYGAGKFIPSFRLAEASQRRPTSALLSGEVNPEGFPLTDCHFEYVPQKQFEETEFKGVTAEQRTPCVLPAAAAIPVDSTFHPVHAEVVGLTSGVTYHYRLLASSSGELGGSGASVSLAFTAPHAPRVDSTTVSNLSSTFAELRAQISPLGAATSYRFEYLTEAAYLANGESFLGPDAATSVPVPDAPIGSGAPTGAVDASVFQQVGGLAPGTVYRFRVLASNECEAVEHPGQRCVTEGEPAIFTTLPQVFPGLPDGRAYELVTPPDKGSAGDMFASPISVSGNIVNRDVGYPSQSGDGFLLFTNSAFGAFPAAEHGAYVFSRAAGGWGYSSLASPSLGPQGFLSTVFDPSDLSRVALTDAFGSVGSPAGSRAGSLLGPPGGPYATLHVDSPLNSLINGSGEDTMVDGASRDLGKVVVESLNHTLAPGAEKQDEASKSLYESSGGGECSLETANCTLINLDPGGALLKCGAVLGQAGAAGGGGNTHNAVSADGSRVFFTAPDPGRAAVESHGAGCWNGAAAEEVGTPPKNAPQLYLRSGGQTVEVSEPEEGVVDPTGRHPAVYVGASEDGSRVFFLSETWLTANHPEAHADPELYEYDSERPEGERLTRVSAGEPSSPGAKAGAGVGAVPAISADGSTVYFMAAGVLAANQGADGTHASAGDCNPPLTVATRICNLYRYDTATATAAFLARVSANDYPRQDNEGAKWWSNHSPTDLALDPNASWYTTPDGRFLLFGSTGDLTGYDNAGGCRVPSGDQIGPCFEVYRYEAPSGGAPQGHLACISCNPTGARPSSPAANAEFARSAEGGGENPAGAPVRAISDDGSYAFFDTTDALVPQDTNKTLDVYEWHNGRISLVSSGKDSAPSFFLGSSPDGSNVFFGTHARLVPQDTDSSGDIYDARICTATDPCIKPPAGETAQCEGDACTNPPPAPIDATPASLTFSGAGNLLLQVLPPTKTVTPKKTIKCSKGKKLSHGKCVKAKSKKKKTKAKKAKSHKGGK